ncbi:MAG: methylenetetrahydrofolate reductase C-terminal domain-containing protein [Coriobacteriales bacterium]|nr:methylenetetrahydrofolate reductase C-terminal domain-containing protein [Coriobacteriales bacterium]
MHTRTNRLKDALGKGEFVVTFEIIPGRGAGEAHQEKELDEARKTWDTGLVHALSITDNPGGRPALLADAVAEEFAQRDITVLVHFTVKDRNRNQLQSQLYALEREGLENVLVMSGDYPAEGWSGGPRPVFDLDPVQTLLLISDMNRGLVPSAPSGARPEQPTRFCAGAVVNPFKYTEGETLTQYAKLDRKVFAGASYLIMQLGYDFRKFDELQRYCRQKGYTVPLIANVFVLTRGTARLMRSGAIAGCLVSDELFALLQAEAEQEDKGKAASLERAAQMVAVCRGMGFAGVHIGGMGLTAGSLTSILTRAEEIKDRWQELAKQLCYGLSGGYYLYNEAASSQTGGEAAGGTPSVAAGNGTPSGEAGGGTGFNLNSDNFAPRTEELGGSRIMRGYGLSRFFHRVVLTRGKGLYGILKRSMGRRERKRGLHRNHGIEHLSKTALYGCMDCGDCGLEACVYSCPMSYCPKNQRNGPCGGSMQGWCEVYPEERYCIWYRAYHRLKKYGETDRLNRYITPPNNWDLNMISGGSNYTHERDNAAHRIPMPDDDQREHDEDRY